MTFCAKCGGLIPSNEAYLMVGTHPCTCHPQASNNTTYQTTYQTVPIQDIKNLTDRIDRLEIVIEKLSEITDKILDTLILKNEKIISKL